MQHPKPLNLKSLEATHRKSNSIHSPITIKNLNNELLSPKSPNGTSVFLKMKYTNASSTRNSPTSRPLKSMSTSKNIQPVAVRSPTNLSSKMDFAPYMLFFPKEEIERQMQHVEARKNNFFTFRDLADKGTTQMAEAQTRELFTPFTTRGTLKKQLDFNKEQETLFLRTADNFLSKSRSVLSLEKKEKEKKEKNMPKIRVQPSLRYGEPQKLIFDEELSHRDGGDDEEKTRVKHPKYIKFIKFDANDKYHFHWSTIADSEPASFKPVVREGASFLVIGKYAYLYGGRSKGLHNDLAILDITKWKWSHPPSLQEHPPSGRDGHTANTYKKMMVIFGGAKNFNVTLNMRECLNDVCFYNTESFEWNYVKCSGDFIEPRRHHTAVVVGKHLLVHGGVSSTGDYLDDLKCLDLVSTRWTTCKEINKDEVGIAFHRACVVLYEFRREISLFKMHDFKNDDKSPLIKEEGIYYFGGRYPDDSMSNTLRILKIGQHALRWITPETLGKPPEARYLHTMVHSRSLNMLIIYGGRNDNLFSKGESPVLGDFCTLQLDTLTWVSVLTLGIVGQPRFAHVSAAIGTSLIIFGGINFNVFCSADVNLIEMDQMVVNKLVNKHRQSRGSGSDLLLNYQDKDKMNPEVKMDDVDDLQKRYAGITSFLPMPSQAKRERSSTTNTDLPTLFKEYFTASKASLMNSQKEL